MLWQVKIPTAVGNVTVISFSSILRTPGTKKIYISEEI